MLKEVFSDGLEKPDDESDVKAQLRADYELWLDNQADPEHQKAWIRLALDLALGFDEADEYVRQEDTIDERHTARIREHHETLKPDLVLLDTESVYVLEGPTTGTDRAALSEPRKTASRTSLEGVARDAHGRTSAQLRRRERSPGPSHERRGLDARSRPRQRHERLCALASRPLVRRRQDATRIPDIALHRSILRPLRGIAGKSLRSVGKDQFEVTETLGLQVRDAVELLVDTIDTIDRQRDRKLLADYPERRLYEAVVSLMMRLVFICLPKKMSYSRPKIVCTSKLPRYRRFSINYTPITTNTGPQSLQHPYVRMAPPPPLLFGPYTAASTMRICTSPPTVEIFSIRIISLLRG